MELKQYLQIMMARRRMLLATFLVTLGATLLFTISQTPVYQSGATYVVKPNPLDPDVRTLASTIEVLSRGQVGQTVAEVASSQMIRAQAADELGLSGEQLQGLSVSSRVVPGTNVVEIAVEGPYPELVRDFASAVGGQTASFVQGLYGVYALELLDEPTLASAPDRPRPLLNLLLGAIAGLALGACLVFLLTYLQLLSEENVPALPPVPSSAAKPAAKAPAAPVAVTPAAKRTQQVRPDASGVVSLPPYRDLAVAMGEKLHTTTEKLGTLLEKRASSPDGGAAPAPRRRAHHNSTE